MLDHNLLKFITAIRDSHPDSVELYTKGQCYNFAKIIRTIRPEAIIYYSQVEGHAYTRVGDRLYDIRGVLPLPVWDYPNIVPLDHKYGDRPHRWGLRDRRRLKEIIA